MTKIDKKVYNTIATQLDEATFNAFFLPSLWQGSRGPKPKIGLFKTFNYILKVLYTGCQWKECPIDKGADGKPEIHYTNVFKRFSYWENEDCFIEIFYQSVLLLIENDKLDISVLHGDGNNIVCKKGGDLCGYNKYKHQKGEKFVPIVENRGNILAPMTVAPVNQADMALLKESITDLMYTCRRVNLEILKGTPLNLDAAFDSKANRKKIWNAGLKPNINENIRNRKSTKKGRKRYFDEVIYKSRFVVERTFAWLDKFRRIVIRYEVKHDNFFAFHLLAFTLVNMRSIIQI